MKNKKLLWILLLVVVIIGLVILSIFIVKSPKREVENTENSNTFQKNIVNEIVDGNINTSNNQQYIKVELDNGILYSIDGTKVESDMVIGTNYFDTTLNDIYNNPQDYYNKKIEIEGMYLDSTPYTFVGRYSTSNICPYCPVGYAYLEYQLNGTIDEEFVDEDTWIKVIGTLAKGNDESSGYQDFYYLNVINLEIMNEKGETTVVN